MATYTVKLLAKQPVAQGTTAFHLEKPAGFEFRPGQAFEVILPGGSVYREQNVIVSPFEDDVTRHHYASTMFMSAHGLSALGLMESDPLLVQAERRLIQQAERLVVLADHSKFERRSGLVLCGLERVHCLITDAGAPDAAVQWLEGLGVPVVRVAPEAD